MQASEVLPELKTKPVCRVAKKKQQGEGTEPGRPVGRPAIGRQVNVRVPDELFADLELIGEALGLDLSNVIRMMLTEQRHIYLARARDARAKLDEVKGEAEGGRDQGGAD